MIAGAAERAFVARAAHPRTTCGTENAIIAWIARLRAYQIVTVVIACPSTAIVDNARVLLPRGIAVARHAAVDSQAIVLCAHRLPAGRTPAGGRRRQGSIVGAHGFSRWGIPTWRRRWGGSTVCNWRRALHAVLTRSIYSKTIRNATLGTHYFSIYCTPCAASILCSIAIKYAF